MRDQQSVPGEMLQKLDMTIVLMPGECRVCVCFPPLPTGLQGQGWGHTPLTPLCHPGTGSSLYPNYSPEMFDKHLKQLTTPPLPSAAHSSSTLDFKRVIPASNLTFPLHLILASGDAGNSFAFSLLHILTQLML